MPLVLDGTNGVSGVDGTASNPAIEGTDSNTGIFYPAADTVAIGTGGTEALRVNSSQNVGIGTQSPAYKLHVSNYMALGTQATSGAGAGISMIPSSTLTNWFVGSNYVTSGAFEIIPSTAGGGSTFTTPAFMLNSSGNAGLGVTPAAWDGTLTGTRALQIGTWGAYVFGTGSGWDSAPYIYVGNNAYYGSGSFRYTSSKASATYYQVGDLHIWANAAAGTAGNAITFVERARITSDGALWVGNTTRQSTSNHTFIQNVAGDWTANFQCNTATAANNYGILINYSSSSPNGTINEFLICNDTVTTRAEIRSNGGLANYSANNVNLSDRREKTNFAPAKNYLDVICAIPVQTFNYIDQNLEEDDGLTLGVVAQDVQAVAPELVMESDWGSEEEPKMRLSIYQTDLQYALMKSIQELKAIVDAQAAEIAALKAQP